MIDELFAGGGEEAFGGMSRGLYQSFFGSQPHKKEIAPLAKNLNSRR